MAANSSTKELFGRAAVMSVKPVTADTCIIAWTKAGNTEPGNEGAGGQEAFIFTGATNVTINYQQQVTRRRTLASAGGRPIAVLYPSQPQGNIQIQRLFADTSTQQGDTPTGAVAWNTHTLFTYPGWNVCEGTADIYITFDGSSAYEGCNSKNAGFKMTGALVTGYSISAEAEGLTVVDNVTVEFLQMFPYGV